MDQEIKEGRGCGPDGSYVVLKLDHLGADVINKRLPSIREIAIKFRQRRPDQGTHPRRADHPLPDGRHSANYHGQVLGARQRREQDRQRPVRDRRMRRGVGARRNRLGTNSLLDLIVFGRATGNHIVDSHPERQHAHQPLPQEPSTSRWRASTG